MRIRESWIAVALLACTPTGQNRSDDTAGRPVQLWHSGRIYTANAADETVEALAVADGRIIAVGTTQDLRAAHPQADEIDLAGRRVVPGFHDVHLHALEAGANTTVCTLSPGADLATYEAEIADCAFDQAGADWVRVAGMSGSVLFEDEPVVDVLDRAVPDRPVLVIDDLGHAAFTNHRGLAAAGIDADVVDPQGGVFTRDPRTGLLDGGLLENAQQRLRDAAAIDAESVYAGLLVGLAELASNGVTSISDAGGYWTRDHPAAWARAEQADLLTVRAHNALYLYPDQPLDAQLARFREMYTNDAERLLRWNTVKIYIDGILSLGSARLLAPYDSPPDPEWVSGFDYFDPQSLRAYVAELTAMGFRLHFHAVGDAAVRTALDLIENEAEAPPSGQHRITHAYLIDPADIPRFAALDVVADFQLGEASSREETVRFFADFIGRRAERLLPVRDLIDASAPVVLSSDWDADVLSPLGIISRSVTRARQAIPDVTSAVRMLTIDPARALGQANAVGSLEVGKWADLVVLDGDIFAMPAAQIADVNVLMTVFEGEVLVDRR